MTPPPVTCHVLAPYQRVELLTTCEAAACCINDALTLAPVEVVGMAGALPVMVRGVVVRLYSDRDAVFLTLEGEPK